MSTQPAIKIEMSCPYCDQTAKLGIRSINKSVRCPYCSGEFPAVPYAEPLDIIRLHMRCSVSKEAYRLVLERERPDVQYRIKTTVASGDSGSCDTLGALRRVRAMQASDVNFNGFACPFCGDSRLAYCSCKTWICQGSSRRTPEGPRIHCPECSIDGTYSTPVLEVEIFQRQVQQPQMLAEPRADTSRLAIPSPMQIEKVRRPR
jgi:hypothetical protein